MQPIIIIFVFLISLIASSLLSASNRDLYQKLDVFGDVFDIIKKNYVEDVNDKKVIEYAINGMLQSLDPHSGYMLSLIHI